MTIRLDWDTATRTTWQELLGRSRSGLQQGWSYGEALRRGGMRVERGIARDRHGGAWACAQVVERRLVGALGAAFLLRGPVSLASDEGPSTDATILAAIRHRIHRRTLVWAPESPPAIHRRPIITGHGTSWLDLATGLEILRRRLASDWRHRFKQAEAGGLMVRRLDDARAATWLLDRNEAYRHEVGYRGPSRAFLGGLAEAARDAGELMLLVAFARGEPVAGVMLIRHGISATYEVGHVTPEGRQLQATHLLLWRGIERLIEDGVRWLDLGGVATDRSPGIARFKLGMGGEVAILPGTFLVRGSRYDRPGS